MEYYFLMAKGMNINSHIGKCNLYEKLKLKKDDRRRRCEMKIDFVKQKPDMIDTYFDYFENIGFTDHKLTM